jgi:hypothetical protein
VCEQKAQISAQTLVKRSGPCVRWNNKEDMILKQWFHIESYSQISKRLPNRSKQGVRERARKLGLLK